MDRFNTYPSRESAGEVLADLLDMLDIANPYLIAIPRGGIQVAEAIADKLRVPINPIIVKKLPIPENPEAGFGAITADGTKVLDEETVNYLRLSEDQINRISEKVVQEIKHRLEAYGSITPDHVKGADAIVVDDGAATGYSTIAALKSIKNMQPKSLIAALPVSSGEAYSKISKIADTTICPKVESTYFFAVGNYYDEWYDLSEEQIKGILKAYRDKYGNK